MEIKAIIVDDEQDGRIVLEHHINKYCENIKLVGSFSNVDETLIFLKSNEVDLLFLDINMPEKNGFDLLTELGNHNHEIIFVTAYDEFAIKAIKYAAFDYLLKPINPEELKSSIDRLEETHFKQQKTQTLINNLQNENASQLALPTKDGYTFIQIPDIIKCEGDSNYSKIYLIDNTFLIAAKTLKAIQELLPSDLFFRIHKSYLINMNFVSHFNKLEGNVLLKDGSKVEVSRRNKAEFLLKMKEI